jgi:hypothetical protein
MFDLDDEVKQFQMKARIEAAPDQRSSRKTRLFTGL